MNPNWSTPYTDGIKWKAAAPDFPNGLPKAKLILANIMGIGARIAMARAGEAVELETYYAQFNPTELSGRIGVTAGRLRPIGSSGPVKNYSSTDEAQFPLKLFFSSLAMKTWPPGTELRQPSLVNAGHGVSWVDARDPVAWLSSFCYAGEWGGAPPCLGLYLKNTLRVQVTVDEIEWKYTLWDNDMIPRIAEVDLKLSEIFSGGHYSRENARMQGWERRSFIGARRRG